MCVFVTASSFSDMTSFSYSHELIVFTVRKGEIFEVTVSQKECAKTFECFRTQKNLFNY